MARDLDHFRHDQGTRAPALDPAAKLKCLFAARSEVKKQFMARLDPAVPAEITIVLPEILSPIYRGLGKTAVTIRDLILRSKGLPTKAEDLYRIYSHAR